MPSLTFLIVGETAKFAEWNAIEELLLYIPTNENVEHVEDSLVLLLER